MCDVFNFVFSAVKILEKPINNSLPVLIDSLRRDDSNNSKGNLKCFQNIRDLSFTSSLIYF